MGFRELALIVAIANVIFIALHSYAVGKIRCQPDDGHSGFHIFMVALHATAGISSMVANY